MFNAKVAELNEATKSSTEFEKRTYTVCEMQDILGIGKNAAYDLIKKGCFKVVRVGGSIRISKKSFDEWLDGRGV